MKRFLTVVFVFAAVLILASCGGGGGGSTNTPGGDQQQFVLPNIAGKWLLTLYKPGQLTVAGTVNWVITQSGNIVTIANPDSVVSVYTFQNDKLSFTVSEKTNGNTVNWVGSITSDGLLIQNGSFVGSGTGAWSGTFTGHKE